jgi:putative peptidoglycan lipid II flippase
MILNIALSLILVRPLSFGGLALANSTATTIEMIVLLWLLRKRLGGIHGRRVGGTALRSLGAAAVMAAVLELWVQWGPAAFPSGFENDWVIAITGIMLGIITYSFISWLLRSEELVLILEMLRSRGKVRTAPGT